MNWTAAERLYLSDYLRSGARGKASASFQSRYTLLQGFNAKGQMLLVIDDQVRAVKGQDGRWGYVLTDDGIKAGLVRLQYVTGMYNDRRLHAFLGQWVYGNQTLWDFAKRPTYWTVAFFVLALFVAVPKDRARRMVWRYGRRLRGPELVTTAEFNERLGRKRWLMVYPPDGIAFINREGTWLKEWIDQLLAPKALGSGSQRARGLALSHRGRHRGGQERGHPAGALADMGARGDGHCVRSGARIPAAVLPRIARRRGPQSPGRALPVLDAQRRSAARGRGADGSEIAVPGSGPGESVLCRCAKENLRAPDQSETHAGTTHILDVP